MTEENNPVKCPCCNLPTLSEIAAYEICTVCGWEDDGQNDDNSEKVLGGPNKDYSLNEARANFKKFNSMYREGDELFPTNKDYNEQVEKLICKYQELENDIVSISVMNEIDIIESKLLTTPRRKSKLP